MKKTENSRAAANILKTAVDALTNAANKGNDTADDAQTKKKYDPSRDKHQKVYGPPAYFDKKSDKEEDSK